LNFATLALLGAALGLDTPGLRDVALLLALERPDEGQSELGSLIKREIA